MLLGIADVTCCAAFVRLFTAAGRLVRGGRPIRLRLAATWPWAAQLTAAITRLQRYAPG